MSGDTLSPDANTSLASAHDASPLNAEEVATLTAIFERMFPADDLGPGATEIGVLDYLQRALSDAYVNLVPTYRAALAGIDAVVRAEFARPFVNLSEHEQNSVIDRLDRRQIAELEQPITAGFFDLLWRHLREGLFSDPIHGGNRDMLGWRLIGFPGAQYGYSAQEQQLDFVITREPRSVADLQQAPKT